MLKTFPAPPAISLPLLCIVISVSCLVPFSSCSDHNHRKGYVYYRLNANPSTLDPARIVDVIGGSISAKLFNGLVRLDEKLNIRPDIAERWSISEDGLSYKFILTKGVKYSNNREVKAYDIKYSFKRVLDPRTRSPNTWVLEKIAGARDFMEGRAADVSGLRAIDDYTLEIRLEKSFSPFLFLLTMPAAYVVPEEEVTRWGEDFSSHPVGTGPFSLKEWSQNNELRLERRENYFEKKAEIKGIVYRVITEDLTVMTEFELGNLDVITIPVAGLAKYRQDPAWRSLIVSVEGINIYYLGMNCSRPPFMNVWLRKALNFAIDRKKLLSTFYEKRGRLAAGPVPDILRKWDASEMYWYDPSLARKIIEREGLTGTTIQFYVTADQEVVDMAEIIQSYLKKAGLDVRIKQLEWSAYKEAVNKGEPDMFWLSWWADYPDPENFLFPLFHSSNIGPAGNRARYRNTKVDKLIELGQSARGDNEAKRYYEKAERLIMDDAPWVFFWYRNDYSLRQPWIANYRTYPIYSMDKGNTISIKDFHILSNN